MSTFIDDARAYRAQGASRKQLISYIKLYGVDDDRAQRLADRLDLELGLVEPASAAPTRRAGSPGTLPALRNDGPPPRASAGSSRHRRSSVRRRPRIDRDELTAHADDVVIDLTDDATRERSGASLQRARTVQAALEHAQQMIDDGLSRQMILEYLVYSGVSPAEAAHVATTIKPSDAEIQIIHPPAGPHRPRRRHDARLSRALAQVVIGAAIGLIGYQVANNGWTGDVSETWFVVLGGAIVLLGLYNVINS